MAVVTWPWSGRRIVLLVWLGFWLRRLLWLSLRKLLERLRFELSIACISSVVWGSDVMSGCMEWVMVRSLVVVMCHVILGVLNLSHWSIIMRNEFTPWSIVMR